MYPKTLIDKIVNLQVVLVSNLLYSIVCKFTFLEVHGFPLRIDGSPLCKTSKESDSLSDLHTFRCILGDYCCEESLQYCADSLLPVLSQASK